MSIVNLVACNILAQVFLRLVGSADQFLLVFLKRLELVSSADLFL